MRTFYDGLNQIDNIFSSKVIILPKLLKMPINSTALNFLGASDKATKLLGYLI